MGIGLGSGDINSKSSSEMKEDVFVRLLNTNRINIGDLDLIQWKKLTDDYPIFGLSTMTMIEKEITINTVAPIKGGLAEAAINIPPIGSLGPELKWSSDDGSTWLDSIGKFEGGKVYKSKYTYTASDDYVFDESIIEGDIRVANLGDGTKKVELNGKTLSITITWPPTEIETSPNWQVNFIGGEGATGIGASQVISGENEILILPANSFTKVGYTLIGWHDGTNNYTVGSTYIMPGGNITFTAQWEVDIPIRYTVIYNDNNETGRADTQVTEVGIGTTIAVNRFIRKGSSFMSWNTRVDGSGTMYRPGDILSPQGPGTSLNLYAQWTEHKYIASGKVNDNENKAVSGTSVKIMKGNRQIGRENVVTDVYGDFTILDLENGRYNLRIENLGIITTKVVNVNREGHIFLGAIKLPMGKTNSIVDIKGDTPDIVVGKLDEQFEDDVVDNDKGVTSKDRAVLSEGGSVEIKFIGELKDGEVANAADINYSAKANSKTVGLYIDLSVLKTVKNSSEEEITTQSAKLIELPNLIEIYIPLAEELQGKSDYVVYRYHGNKVDIITTQANTDGEKTTLLENDKIIQLTAKKFSTYAVAFKAEESDPPTPPTPPYSNYGDDDDDYHDIWKDSTVKEESKINLEDSESGKIQISKDKKTATITPDKGYVIADLIIDGKSVGASEKYRFTDDKGHKVIPIFVKKTTLPYYMKDNKKVYIGFSNIVGNIYKSIIPKGFKIEFGENPKYFKDNTIKWAKSSIEFLTQREILLGRNEDIFSPNESMTRAMFVTATGRLYESSYGEIKAVNTFSDVGEDDYYGKYVSWAVKNKIVKGIGENKFAPNDQLTREQMAAIILNFANFINREETKEKPLEYTDKINISTWAIDGVKYCQESGIMMGRESGDFAPQERATRAEVALVLERFIKEIVKNTK